ncbi:hypothetical protein B0O99DRAFT_602291 [Bisporella sp. PMI_857]|nr:hypothetical protein B0O99DRAFT_602291 [Bisporella sp. PMI_857]
MLLLLTTLAGFVQVAWTCFPSCMARQTISPPRVDSDEWLQTQVCDVGNMDGFPGPQKFRLRKIGASIELNGFPASEATSGNPGFLQMQNPYPAAISYVLGKDWGLRLNTSVWCNDESKCGVGYIFVSDDPVDEASHCLRMRRCGATYRERYRAWDTYPQEPLNGVNKNMNELNRYYGMAERRRSMGASAAVQIV